MTHVPLNDLGLKHGTDKASHHHNYLHIYESYVKKYLTAGRVLLVDAVGGYQFPDRGGESLRMWAEYFPHGKIIGIDLYEKTLHMPENVSLYQCNQTDAAGLAYIFESEGAPDVFVDDFSHFNKETIQTFNIVFPWVKPGGIYIVEDIEGSWYSEHGYGGTTDEKDFYFPSIINYFRHLLNVLNRKFIGKINVDHKHLHDIQSIHFYQNTIIVLKK